MILSYSRMISPLCQHGNEFNCSTSACDDSTTQSTTTDRCALSMTNYYAKGSATICKPRLRLDTKGPGYTHKDRSVFRRLSNIRTPVQLFFGCWSPWTPQPNCCQHCFPPLTYNILHLSPSDIRPRMYTVHLEYPSSEHLRQIKCNVG